MGWKLSLSQRIRAGVSLVVVFLLVLATNLIDKNHFRVVQENLKTVYEDRLLAKDYLYKLSRQIQLKKEMIQNPGVENLIEINRSLDDSIQTLLNKFATTKLTEKESKYFASLQENILLLSRYENNNIFNESLAPEAPFSPGEEKYFQSIYEDMDALFKIQLMESNRVINNSNRAIDKSNLISRIEIIVLITLGILIQLVVFLKPLK
ncbi:MAG: MCP four helix bundle domain-containing protein [Ekhidna sp.]|uniref:hypothetical protein n=1 Tax=Ekhidna sp. TaxID=2608089 RepID=UPI0032EB2087